MASTAVSPQAAPVKGAVGVDVNDKVATPVKRKAQPVSYWRLFRFADRIDVALFVVGIIANLGNGIIFPMFRCVSQSESSPARGRWVILRDDLSFVIRYK